MVYQVWLMALSTNQEPPPRLKVPMHKNIFFYPAKKKKKKKVFFNNLNGQTSYQHLHRWLTPPHEAHTLWLTYPVTLPPLIHRWPRLCCPVTPFPLWLPLRASCECLWIFNVSTSKTCRKTKRQENPCQWYPKPTALHTAATQPQPECYSHYWSPRLNTKCHMHEKSY